MANVMFTKTTHTIFVLLVSVNSIALAETNITKPIYEPEKIINLAESYLVDNEEKFGWCQHSLEGVSFSYTNGAWFLSYDCEEKRPGYHFDLWASNDEVPEFTYLGIGSIKTISPETRMY